MAYNEQVGNLNLVLFNDALNHLSIIHRILRLQGSHALLVGVSGSGKKALAKLAAFVAGLRTFEISLSKTYGEPELCEDIKRLYMQMAENTDQYTFIFTDTHVRSEGGFAFSLPNPESVKNTQILSLPRVLGVCKQHSHHGLPGIALLRRGQRWCDKQCLAQGGSGAESDWGRCGQRHQGDGVEVVCP